MKYEDQIEQVLMEQGKVSLQKDVFPLILEEFKLSQMNEEMYVMACEFVKQQLYAVHLSGIPVVCYPIFNGEPSSGSLSVVDMIWEKVVG